MRTAPAQMRPRLAPASRAMISLTAFSTLGGLAAAMVTGEPPVGFAVYYVLAIAGLCSPEGSPLRRGLRRVAGRPQALGDRPEVGPAHHCGPCLVDPDAQPVAVSSIAPP